MAEEPTRGEVMSVVPRQVVIKYHWPELGRLIDVRVKVGGTFMYTTRVLSPDQRLVDLVRQVRREFRSAQ